MIKTENEQFSNTSPYRAENGDLVKCINSKLKYLENGKIYIVKSTVTTSQNDWRNGISNKQEWASEIKVEGSNAYLSNTNFTLIDEATVREIGVDILLGNDNLINSDKAVGRKFDRINDIEKNRQLSKHLLKEAEYMSSSYYSPSYTNYKEMLESVIKSDRIFGFENSDFREIGNMRVSDFFNKYIKNEIESRD